MIKVGIAGFGKIGQLRAKILSKRDDIRIVGIYDPVKSKNNLKYNFYNILHFLFQSFFL